MNAFFKELDYQSTSIGDISLRVRRDPRTDEPLYEIKLDDEYLMSSMFTESETALGRLGIDEHPGDHLHVVVGGLGLGYTARAVLESPRVASLVIVETLQPVIDWHTNGLLPLGAELTGDSRCRFVRGDFFSMAASPHGFDPEQDGRRFDAILVDIDHSPGRHLAPAHASLYQPDGLARLSSHMNPAGIFGLWSNNPVDPDFTGQLRHVFRTARGENIVFHNHLQDRDSTQSIYLAQR
ncbi:MAG: spermidine synthase [Spirochaeta sp.]